MEQLSERLLHKIFKMDRFFLFFASLLSSQLLFGQLAPFSYLNKRSVQDPYFSNVVLLLPMENNFNDIKGHSMFKIGNPLISSLNVPSPYGSFCGTFGLNNRIEFANSADFYLGQTFTIEFWAKPTSTDLNTGIHEFYGQRSGPGGVGAGFQFGIYNGKLFHWIGTTIFDGSTPGNPLLLAGVNYHIALVYDEMSIDKKIRVFINGSLKFSLNYVDNPVPISSNLAIGGDVMASTYSQHYFGTIKDMRVTKGVARYNLNFTPPSSFYPNQ
jgi:hypothetical protein